MSIFLDMGLKFWKLKSVRNILRKMVNDVLMVVRIGEIFVSMVVSFIILILLILFVN